MMMRMMAVILPCKEVVEAVSSGGIADQPLWRKPLFVVHLAGCGFCSRFAKQMDLIRRVLVERFSVPKREDNSALEKRVLARIRRG